MYILVLVVLISFIVFGPRAKVVLFWKPAQEQVEITDNLSFAGSTVMVSECTDMPPTSFGVSISGATIDCNQTNQELKPFYFVRAFP